MKHFTTKTKVARAAMTLLVVMLGSVMGAWADETLTVYNGTDDCCYIPVEGYYTDTQGAASEFVVPSDVLTDMKDGTIFELKFYLRQPATAEWTATIKVYLKEVSGTTLTGIAGPDASTVVYTGTLNATGSEMTVSFDTPFKYNGGNLLIGTFVSVAGNWKSAYFYGVKQNNNNTAWYRTSASSTGYAQKFIPKTTFTYIPAGIPVCLKPTLTVGNITQNGATLTCNYGSGTYNVQYAIASSDNWQNAAQNSSQTTFTLTNLTPLTAYDVRVQSVCDGGNSGWQTASFITTAVAVAVGDSWSDNFEGTSCGWELINGTCTNAWVWGTATKNGGTHALYISNNGGATNTYTTDSGTKVFATKLLTFDEGKYEFAYDWVAKGESTYDFLRVALVPSTQTLTAGTDYSTFGSSSLPSGWIALDGGSKLNLATEWQRHAQSVKVAAGNYYLVVVWRNDVSGGTNPPAAIDNVSITKMACSADVTDLAVNDITAGSVALTWTAGGATQWQVAYSTTSNFEGATKAIVSNPTYSITGLQPNTHYYARARVYCGGEDFGSWSDVLQFNTDCGVITKYPWTENFDGVTVESASSQTLPNCWRSINTTTNNSYKVFPTIFYYSSTNYANSTPNCLKLYSYAYFNSNGNTTYDPQPQYAILPPMEDLGGKLITLYAKGNNTSSTFKIGTMSNPTNASTFTMIAEQTLTTSYPENPFEYIIPATCTDSYVAIVMDAATQNRSSNCVYIDDIVICEAPSCLKPTDLAVTATTSNTATLSWTNGAEGQNAWQICLNNDETGLKSAISNPFTVEGLTPGTLYTAKVRACCSADDHSDWSKEISFITQCAPITITESNTYSQGFEGYTGAAYNATNGVVPACWDSYSTGSVAPHIIGKGDYRYVHEGTQALTFYGSGYCYAALPEFTNDLSKLRISFWMQTESASNGELILGYITAEDNNFNTFTAIETYARNNGSMVQHTTYLNNVPTTATQLVFRWYYSSQYSCCIDDVEVSLIPSCISPTGLTATDITATSAKLSWTAGGSENKWTVYYKKASEENYSSTTATENPFDLTGLTGATDYEFYVVANCSDTDESEPSKKCSFTTDCEEATIPYTYNFEDADPFMCWHPITGAAIAEGSSNAHGGSKYLKFSGTTSNLIALPPFANTTNTLRLEFWTRPESNTYSSCGSFAVGYLTDLSDPTSFVAIATYNYNDWSSNTYEKKVVNFNAAPTNAYIAMRQYNCVTYYYWFVDDVTVKAVPSCTEPTGLAVVENSIDGHGATITWDAVEGATFQWKTGGGWEETQGHTVVLTGLTPETNYTFTLRKKCSDTDVSEEVSVSFTTAIAWPKPTGLEVTANGQNATFTWASPSTASKWEVARATDANAAPADNIVATVTNASYTAKDLAIDIDHFFWVRAFFDTDGYSEWVGPASVHIGYCTPDPSSRDGKGITKVAFGTGDNVVNNVDETNGLPASTPYYYNYSSLIGAVHTNEEATVNITYDTYYSYGTIIWVDWDNSLTFEDSEIVYTGTSPEGTGNTPQVLVASFTIPANQATGDYRMRIAGAYSHFYSFIGGNATGSHSACFSSTYAVCHDYTLRVLPTPSCLKPTNVTITPTPTSATVSWEGSNAKYMVRYREAGQEAFTSLEVSGTTVTIENLKSSTSYECQVQSVDGNSTSDWTNPEVFTTLAANPIPADIAVSNITPETATVSWNGFGDSYNVQYRTAAYVDGISEPFGTTSPVGWERYTGLLTDIMSGTTTLSLANSGWSFGTSNGVFDNHAYTEISNNSQNWLVSPAVTIPANGELTFDLALTACSGTPPTPQTTGTDDKFVVLVSTDNKNTWKILRQWDNASSDYVYNYIACSATGVKVSIDLTLYTGQSVNIAFYGESTIVNADNILHIDNVVIGTSHQASDWSLLNTTDKMASLTNLTANTQYECQVQSVKTGLENSDWSSPATFATIDYKRYDLTGVNVLFFETNDYSYDVKEIRMAIEGQTVTVSLNPDNVPDNQYLTGKYLSADGVVFTMKDNGDATFVMPAKAVTVTAELANRSEYLIDLTTASTQEINEEIYETLNQQEGYFYSDDEGQMYLDLNRDGNADLQLTQDDNAQTNTTTYGVTRLDGANQLEENYRFTIRTFPGLLPSPYSTVFVKLSNINPEKNLPVIDVLLDKFDNTTDIAAWAKDGKSRNIMLDQRTLYRDGDWNTLCLPFDLTAERVTDQLAAPTELKTLDTGSFSNGVLTLNFKDATTIEAGKPYIVKWANTASNLDNPVFYNVVVRDVRADVTTSDVDFKGTYEAREFYSEDPSVLFLGGSNTLYYPQPTLTDPNKEWSDVNPMIYPFIGAFRAYFKVNLNGGTDGVRAFVLNFGDGEESQGIGDAARLNNNEERINNKWYTVDGRKLDTKPTKKGLYIHGGKKVVIP